MDSTQRYLKPTQLVPLLCRHFEVEDEVSGHAVKLVRARIEKYYEDYESVHGHTPPWVQRKHRIDRDYWQIDRDYWQIVLTGDPEIKRFFAKRSSDPAIRSAREAATQAAKNFTGPFGPEEFEESAAYPAESPYANDLITEDKARHDIYLKIEALFDTLVDFDFAQYVEDLNEHEELLRALDAESSVSEPPTEDYYILKRKYEKLGKKLSDKRNYAKLRINQGDQPATPQQ